MIVEFQISGEVAETARRQAAAKGLSFGDYLSQCVTRAVLNIDELDRIRAEAWAARQAS